MCNEQLQGALDEYLVATKLWQRDQIAHVIQYRGSRKAVVPFKDKDNLNECGISHLECAIGLLEQGFHCFVLLRYVLKQ